MAAYCRISGVEGSVMRDTIVSHNPRERESTIVMPGKAWKSVDRAVALPPERSIISATLKPRVSADATKGAIACPKEENFSRLQEPRWAEWRSRVSRRSKPRDNKKRLR